MPIVRVCLLAFGVVLLGCPSAPGQPEPDPDPTPAPGLSSVPMPACASPGAPGWDDITDDVGVDFVSVLPDWEQVGWVILADFDGDHFPDLVHLQRFEEGAFLYWNRGDGTFQPGAVPEYIWDEEMFGGSAADYDGDGDLDVLLVGPDTVRLWRNDGGRAFTDVTAGSGLDMGPNWGGGATWGDYDGDGDLDLYISVMHALEEDDDDDDAADDDDDGAGAAGGPNQLWRNDDGVFTSVGGPTTVGLGLTHHSAFADFDDDGDLDLLVLNEHHQQEASELWENLGDGEWADRGVEAFGVLHAPMGALIADVDNDGHVDLWTTDISDMPFFRGGPNFEFVEVTATWLEPTDHAFGDTSWSLMPVDPDGDGRLDVFVSYGRDPDTQGGDPSVQPDRFYVRAEAPGEPPFFVHAPDMLPASLPVEDARGVGHSDIDGDGVPDLVVRNIVGPAQVLRGRCTEAHRLVVRLRDSTARNSRGLGALVRVDDDPGLVVTAGTGSYSSNEPELYFGVGDRTAVTLTVRWLDGEEQHFEGVCTSCVVEIRR